MTSKERLTETIPAFRVPRSVYETLISRAKLERRTSTDVARALLERGIAALRRDGLLFEPEGTQEPAADVSSEAGQTPAERRTILAGKQSLKAR